MDDSSQQDSTKKKSTASTNMHRLIISPKPCRINQEIKARADPRKSIPERGQKRAYHIIRYRPIYRIMHSSRSSSRPAELGRKEKERKKIKGSFTYSWTRRHGQNPRQAFEFTCTCSSSDNERDQRNIPIHTGRQKKEMWNIFGGQSKQCILFMYNCRKLRSLVLLALAPHVDTCHFVGGTNVIPDQPIRIQSWVRGWPNVNNGQSKLLKRQI